MYSGLLVALLLACSLHASTAIIYKCNQTAACGCSAANANMLRIVGGEDAYTSSWGWAVSLQSLYGEHFCTGSVVSPLHVITAAHCVTNPNFVQLVQVVIGINELSDNTSATMQVRRISQVFSHPNYDNVSTNVNDIAVLRLSLPFTLSTAARTARVCLPRIALANEISDYPGDYGPLVLIGWGSLQYRATEMSDALQQATLQAIPADDDRCSVFNLNSSTQFCAGVDGGEKGRIAMMCEKVVHVSLIVQMVARVTRVVR